MKIKLVEPAWYLPNGDLLRPKELLLPSLTLPLLAALTPKGTDVVIENDQLGEIDFDEKVSLVGITSYTHQIVRAYEIADTSKYLSFRRKGLFRFLPTPPFPSKPGEAALIPAVFVR